MPSVAFARFWQVDLTRECFLGHLDQVDLLSLRLVSQGFASTLAPVVFKEVSVNFDATCFGRQARMAALGRVGGFVKSLTFSMPRTDDTFLPPLVDPDTLEEITFDYEPKIYPSRPSSSTFDASAPKYGSWELNDLLVRQYPLLFHAATNIPSFIRALKTMPKLRHLRISCPNIQQSNRRDIVDYALISLRIAIEQVNPEFLERLSIDQMRLSSLYYLRPSSSIGTSPASTRVWRRIKTLGMVVNSPVKEGLAGMATTDHLKILHTYISTFTTLEHLTFTWAGLKGPSPLSLSTEQCIAAPSALDYSSCVKNLSSSPPSLSSSPSSTRSLASSYFEPFAPRPVTTSSPLRPLRLSFLKSMRLQNAIFDASQASSFIYVHRKTLTEFQFESCQLRSGTWDDALAPLTKMSGSEAWKKGRRRSADRSISDKSSCGSLHRRRPPLKMHTFLPLSEDTTPSHCKNEIFEVPLILSPSEEVEDLQLAIRERLWMPSDTLSAFDEDEYDYMSHSSFGLNRRRRGVMALKRIGRKIGLASLKEERESDLAMDGVRKLLGTGGRHTW